MTATATKTIECEHETCTPQRTFKRPNELGVHNAAVRRQKVVAGEVEAAQAKLSAREVAEVNRGGETTYPCGHATCTPRKEYTTKKSLGTHNTRVALREQAEKDLRAQGLDPVSGAPLASNDRPPNWEPLSQSEKVIGVAHVMYGAEVVSRDPHMQDIENIVSGSNSPRPPVVLAEDGDALDVAHAEAVGRAAFLAALANNPDRASALRAYALDQKAQRENARGVEVRVRFGVLFVDDQPANVDEFIGGIRLAIKVTR